MEIPNQKYHTKGKFQIRQNKSHCIFYDIQNTDGEFIGHAVFPLLLLGLVVLCCTFSI